MPTFGRVEKLLLGHFMFYPSQLVIFTDRKFQLYYAYNYRVQNCMV